MSKLKNSLEDNCFFSHMFENNLALSNEIMRRWDNKTRIE